MCSEHWEFIYILVSPKREWAQQSCIIQCYTQKAGDGGEKKKSFRLQYVVNIPNNYASTGRWDSALCGIIYNTAFCPKQQGSPEASLWIIMAKYSRMILANLDPTGPLCFCSSARWSWVPKAGTGKTVRNPSLECFWGCWGWGGKPAWKLGFENWNWIECLDMGEIKPLWSCRPLLLEKKCKFSACSHSSLLRWSVFISQGRWREGGGGTA